MVHIGVAPGIRAATLADGVYEQLRSEIVLGTRQPNALLLEEEVAGLMQVSRTPVREALQRLAKDGLIVSRSRRWFVVQPTIQDIRDIYGVRSALEGFAARLATERAADDQLAAIGVALASRRRAGPNIEDFVVSNEHFHRSIVEAAGNPRLLAATERNKHFYFNAQVGRLYGPDELATSHREHEALLEAIRDRDADAADQITRRHIAGALALIEQRSEL